ncbi:MAG: RNA methyltransferase, partial [Acidobacteria bacterium]|nr:RNA methyltransferase [Acidobacteriota bacterium]
KQCGRRRLVEITEPISFVGFCNGAEAVSLIFSERGGTTLREIAASLHSPTSLTLCVASEGGWSDAELQAAEAHNVLPVHLGQRILRTETAAIAAVTLAQHLFGDLR